MISPERRQKAEEIIASFPEKHSAMIPLLHLWQDAEGYLSDESLAEVAEVLQMTPAEVQDVVSFYTMFRRKPLGKYHIEVCKGLSCALCGAHELIDHLKNKLGVDLLEPTADGLFSLDGVECLAACDRGPVAQVNLHYEGPLDPESADHLIEDLRKRAATEGMADAEAAPAGEGGAVHA